MAPRRGLSPQIPLEEVKDTAEIILVTGGSGFLGQHLVRELQRDPSVGEIRVLDLKPYHRRLEGEQRIAVQSIVGDIRDLESSRPAFRGVHCVYHCAALVSYQFPPDLESLHDNNVRGTENVVRLCVEEAVQRLVFSSSAEVTLVPYLGTTFSVVVNQTESRALPPENESSLVIPGYAASKLKAERIVLQAHGTALKGGGKLRTVALRPTLLYGELDPHLLPPLLKLARICDGHLPLFAGAGGRQQFTYVGNAAWAHLCAAKALREESHGTSSAGGLPVFVTDDTLPEDLLRFCARVTAKPDGQHRLRLSRWWVPSFVSYLLAATLEVIVNTLRLPPLPLPPRAVVSFLGSVLMYNRLRAAISLRYSPQYSQTSSLHRSGKWYSAVLQCPKGIQ